MGILRFLLGSDKKKKMIATLQSEIKNLKKENASIIERKKDIYSEFEERRLEAIKYIENRLETFGSRLNVISDLIADNFIKIQESLNEDAHNIHTSHSYFESKLETIEEVVLGASLANRELFNKLSNRIEELSRKLDECIESAEVEDIESTQKKAAPVVDPGSPVVPVEVSKPIKHKGSLEEEGFLDLSKFQRGELMERSEAAAYLNVSKVTLLTWEKTGVLKRAGMARIPSKKGGPSVFYRKDHIDLIKNGPKILSKGMTYYARAQNSDNRSLEKKLQFIDYDPSLHVTAKEAASLLDISYSYFKVLRVERGWHALGVARNRGPGSIIYLYSKKFMEDVRDNEQIRKNSPGATLEEGELISQQQAAKLLQILPETLEKWTVDGKISPVNKMRPASNAALIYRMDDIRKIMEENKLAPPKKVAVHTW